MNLIYVHTVLTVAVLGLAGYMAVTEIPRRWALGTAASLLIIIGAMGSVVALTYNTLGQPKPFSWESHERGQLLWFDLDEGEAIYVWVRWPGEHAPKAYVMPWDLDKAQQAVSAMAAALTGHASDVVIGRLPNRDGDFVIHPTPVPPAPPKDFH